MLRNHFFNQRVRIRVLKTLAVIFALGAITLVTCIWLLADKMVTPKRRVVSEWHERILNAPNDYGIVLDPFVVKATDGIDLQAMQVTPSPNPGPAKKRHGMEKRLTDAGFSTKNRGLVLVIHGRGGIKEDALPITERFVAAGFACVIYDTRAHGQSGGRFCTYGHCEVPDALAVLAAALSRAGLNDSVPTFGFGYSLGAAVMIQTLAKSDALSAAAVVAPFCDLEELVVYSGGKYSAGKLPNWMAETVVHVGEYRAGFQSREIQPLTAAQNITKPVFVIHGKLDKVIPIDQGRRVFDAIPIQHKRWRESPDAYHGDVLSKGGDELYQEILEFYLTTLRSNRV